MNTKLILLVLIMGIMNPLFGQNKKHKSNSSKRDYYVDQDTKIDTTVYATTTRREFYPFSIAKEVRLISFERHRIKTTDTMFYKNDSNFNFYIEPFNNDSINPYFIVYYSKMLQSVTLTTLEIDSLTDILYNTCSRWISFGLSNMASCYNPHNSILFVDENNKVFDYIEFCFDCNRFKYSSKEIKELEFCHYTMKGIQDYFQYFGLKNKMDDFL